ncbi:hypothetical protein [Tolumonas lignilytica]|uniref:hypothetical protein n=1 Tax=Tolumonas lignilytica TaxID=1283284 RepID=UPI000466C689|nr:hypothetical protein [Tolumonas lignilytica]
MCQKFNPYHFVSDYEILFPNLFWVDIERTSNFNCLSRFGWPICCYLPESHWETLLKFHQISFDGFVEVINPSKFLLPLSSIGAWRKLSLTCCIAEDDYLSAEELPTPNVLPVEKIIDAAKDSPYLDFIDCENLEGCFVNIEWNIDDEFYEIKILYVVDDDFYPVWITLGEWDVLTGIKKSLQRRDKLSENESNKIANLLYVRATSIVKILLQIEKEEIKLQQNIPGTL